jgi:hypothetical protein
MKPCGLEKQGAIMAQTARVYRVLIASPSDLSEERDVATQVVNDWNAQHSADEGVVLLPVRWETHARPASGRRPQVELNEQIVQSSDFLIGMFWTKIGTSTGAATSGTVEEIDQFVAASKPAMLYFSRRPIDPDRIDAKQNKKLKKFKAATYKIALTGTFNSLDKLREILLRDLLRQVRAMKKKHPLPRRRRIEEAQIITDIIVAQKTHGITPAEFVKYRDELLKPRRRSKTQTQDPAPGEVGPNGHRVTYTAEGDKVEWIPDEENEGEEWPLILRRNDKAILAAEEEFFDVIWYDRKLGLLANIAEGREEIAPDIKKGMLAGMRRVEKKYGKKKLKTYYKDDFEWGMLNGKLSALRWVMGAEWDMLDT